MHSRSWRWVALLPLPACRGPTAPEILVTALHAADAGDASAWDMCEQLQRGQGRGQCLIAAMHAMPEAARGPACDRIERAGWRSECWFELAEDLGKEARWDDAIARCAKAGDYVGDCARHLWWVAQLDGVADPALHARLATAFPSEAAALTLGDATIQRIAADRASQSVAEAEGRALEQRTEAARSTLDWEARVRKTAAIDPAECPEEERSACTVAMRSVFQERWRRAVDRNAGALAALCGGRGKVGARLATGGDPELEAALGELRAERCQE